MTTPPPPAGFTPGPWYWNAGRHTGPSPRREPRTLCSRTAKSPVDGTDAHVLIPAAKVTAVQAAAIKNIELEIHAKTEDENLLSAAPDLYAACKAMYEAFLVDNDRMTPSQQEAARLMYAALAKANGGAQ